MNFFQNGFCFSKHVKFQFQNYYFMPRDIEICKLKNKLQNCLRREIHSFKKAIGEEKTRCALIFYGITYHPTIQQSIAIGLSMRPSESSNLPMKRRSAPKWHRRLDARFGGHSSQAFCTQATKVRQIFIYVNEC